MTLGKAYDEIMDKLEVTPEMRARVLKRIQAEEISPAKTKVLPFPGVRRYLSAAACLVLILAGAAVLPRLAAWESFLPPVLTLPGMEEAASLQELSRLVGFEVETDFCLPFGAEETVYTAYQSGLAQIEYRGEGQTATYRQSAGTQDNSGDYTDYSDTVQIAAGERRAILSGDGGAYALAVWTEGEYVCSLRLSQPISAEAWRGVLREAE